MQECKMQNYRVAIAPIIEHTEICNKNENCNYLNNHLSSRLKSDIKNKFK